MWISELIYTYQYDGCHGIMWVALTLFAFAVVQERTPGREATKQRQRQGASVRSVRLQDARGASAARACAVGAHGLGAVQVQVLRLHDARADVTARSHVSPLQSETVFV